MNETLEFFAPCPRGTEALLAEELRMLIATAGLELESLTGNFRSGGLGPGVDAQTAIARKPA